MKKGLFILIIALLLFSSVITAFEANNTLYNVDKTSLGTQGGTGETSTYSARFQTTTFQETRDPANTSSTSSEIGIFSEAIEEEVERGSGGGNILEYGRKKEWAFTIGDGICQYTLGEDRFNSRHDCRPSIVDYTVCLISKKRCFDEYMWREAIGLFLITILIIYILRRLRFLILAKEEEKKKKSKKPKKK